MPMHDISTLIYRINTFKSGVSSEANSESLRSIDTTETVNMEPSEASIKNILNFARSYDVIETKSAGYVEMILN